jgi:hypothetical protein
LPGSPITSLEVEIDLPDIAPNAAVRRMTAQLGTALQQLQQLHTLKLRGRYPHMQEIGFDAALPGMGALIRLTNLELLTVGGGSASFAALCSLCSRLVAVAAW